MRALYPSVSPAVATALAADEGAPRCDATRATRYLNDTASSDYRCEFSARYEHEGKHYCTRHASLKALAILIEGRA